MAHTNGTIGEHSHRMLKKPDLLTRPTPARRDPPFRGQGRSEQPTMVLPSLLVYVAQDGSDEFPTARVLSIPPVPFQG